MGQLFFWTLGWPNALRQSVTHDFPLGPHGPPIWRFRPQGFAYVLFVLLAAPVAVLSQELRDDGFVTPNSVAGTLAATADRQSEGALDGFQGLCCTNHVRDSSCESSVVAGLHEQTNTTDLQDQELASLQ